MPEPPESSPAGGATPPLVPDPLTAVQDQFVLEWGRMSSSWGINRTMAQIHALLMATGRPMSMDEIIERLAISRGNASMSLRDLMEWGVVQRFRRPGDRKDIYQCDTDPWHIVARVARERKRRELDPTGTALRECIARLPATATDPETVEFRHRLTSLLGIFDLIDLVYEQVFKTDESLRLAVESLTPPPALGKDPSNPGDEPSNG